MDCSACGTPYHEASGHRHSERTVLCGPCARDYVKFIKSHTKRKWGGLLFYEHAATSVKPSTEEVGAGTEKVGAGTEKVGAGTEKVGAGTEKVGGG